MNNLSQVETYHVGDRGDSENVHELSKEQLKQRKVVKIDIANDHVLNSDYKAHEDPSKFKSAKVDRGPLKGNWIQTANPVMTAYKLVTIEFKWLGLQNKVSIVSFSKSNLDYLISFFAINSNQSNQLGPSSRI